AVALAGGYALHRLHLGTPGSAAYVVSKAGAARLLSLAPLYPGPTDLVLFGGDFCNRLAMYTVLPGPCWQHQHMPPDASAPAYLASTLEHTPRRKRGPVEKLAASGRRAA